MLASASLDAHEHLEGEMTFCSLQAGWRALLLRSYVDPPVVEELIIPTTPDHKLVLVTAGSCNIESKRDGRWRRAAYRAGHIGMIGPGEPTHLRWRSAESHGTLQVHLPAAVMAEVADELYPEGRAGFAGPTVLAQHDLAISSAILALERAARDGAPDLHAEITARYLALHVMAHRGRVLRPSARHGTAALRAVEDVMRAHLAGSLSLEQLASVAGLSRFQLLREAKAVWGETPMRRLSRLRMEHAQHLLLHTAWSIIEIALECGYGNPSHFATAFRRHAGVAPSDLRR